jgi:hypothetical protein
MTPTDVAHLRLVNQQIVDGKFKRAQELVRWMGALQAQDYIMAKLAFGVRLPTTTEVSIEEALNKGKMVRTHVLRPTWHIVPAEDAAWMLELTAPHILSSLSSRHKELELNDAVFKKSNAVIEKALADGKHLTRQELWKRLEKAKLVKPHVSGTTIENERVSHLILRAELDRIICNGSANGKERPYALFDERVKKSKQLKRDEALAELATRYFTSRSPATLHDFIWWSGLPVADAKLALQMVKGDFVSVACGEQTYWVSKAQPVVKPKESACLLPSFDEFLISYKDRSASLPLNVNKTIISINGIFKPIIVINGQVAGLWKRILKKNNATIELTFFKKPTRAVKDLLEASAMKVAKFQRIDIEIVHA